MPNNQEQCEQNGGIYDESTDTCTESGAADTEPTESEDNPWQFEGLDLDDIQHTPATGETSSSWDVTDEFISEGGAHTYDSDGIIDWLYTQGFGTDDLGLNESGQTANEWFTEEFGNLGDILAFDQSEIDDLGIGFAMQEDAMSSEYQQWESGAHDMLYGEGYDPSSMSSDEIGGAIGNMKTLAQQQLDAFDLANTERKSQEKKNTADLRRSALQGLATTRRASARSGISSGMGSTRALDSFMSQSREQSVSSRAAQKDYSTSVTSTQNQLNFNVQSAMDSFTNEQASKQLSNENAMTQMNYDFAAQASSAYDNWYNSLVGMTGAYFQDTAFDGDTGMVSFDLFGTGG